MSRVPEFRGNTPRSLEAIDGWVRRRIEPALEPDLPIVDPHHHLWNDDRGRYLVDEFLADVATGHRIVSTVYAQFKAMYLTGGEPRLRPVGEVEFARKIGEQCQLMPAGTPLLCKGIVGHADLLDGEQVQEVLEAMIVAGDGRFRGIRHGATYDSGAAGYGRTFAKPHVISDPVFRRGFSRLSSLGLSFDAWLFYPQLPDLVDLLQDFPDTPVVLNHVGGILGVPPHVDREEVFAVWRTHIRRLASFSNLSVKVGGLGMLYCGWDFHEKDSPPDSEALAAAWRPYVETCIETFGPARCMLESNFPVDKQTCGYGTLWNAFKRITAGLSTPEKDALYRGTATRFYRLNDGQTEAGPMPGRSNLQEARQ